MDVLIRMFADVIWVGFHPLLCEEVNRTEPSFPNWSRSHHLCLNWLTLSPTILLISPKVLKSKPQNFISPPLIWSNKLEQGILKGEVSLYHWPPVLLVWISIFCKWKQKLSVVIPNQSNRRSTVQWYSPFGIPRLECCPVEYSLV